MATDDAELVELVAPNLLVGRADTARWSIFLEELSIRRARPLDVGETHTAFVVRLGWTFPGTRIYEDGPTSREFSEVCICDDCEWLAGDIRMSRTYP